MYICRECKAEYKQKVDYCDCGNNTFDFVEDAPVQAFKNTEKETDFRDERAFYEAVSYHPVFEYTGGTAQKTVIAYDENNQATAASVEYSVLKDICVTDKKDDYEKICSYCMPRSQIYDCMCSLAASFFYNGKCS